MTRERVQGGTINIRDRRKDVRSARIKNKKTRWKLEKPAGKLKDTEVS
jgi:hypothetical protein